MIDTESKWAFPLLVGPRYELNKHFDIGLLVGGLLRQVHYPESDAALHLGPRVFYTTGETASGTWELLGMYGLTSSFTIEHLTFQALLNHEILNLSFGVQFEL